MGWGSSLASHLPTPSSCCLAPHRSQEMNSVRNGELSALPPSQGLARSYPASAAALSHPPAGQEIPEQPVAGWMLLQRLDNSYPAPGCVQTLYWTQGLSLCIWDWESSAAAPLGPAHIGTPLCGHCQPYLGTLGELPLPAAGSQCHVGAALYQIIPSGSRVAPYRKRV